MGANSWILNFLDTVSGWHAVDPCKRFLPDTPAFQLQLIKIGKRFEIQGLVGSKNIDLGLLLKQGWVVPLTNTLKECMEHHHHPAAMKLSTPVASPHTGWMCRCWGGVRCLQMWRRRAAEGRADHLGPSPMGLHWRQEVHWHLRSQVACCSSGETENPHKQDSLHWRTCWRQDCHRVFKVQYYSCIKLYIHPGFKKTRYRTPLFYNKRFSSLKATISDNCTNILLVWRNLAHFQLKWIAPMCLLWHRALQFDLSNFPVICIVITSYTHVFWFNWPDIGDLNLANMGSQ